MALAQVIAFHNHVNLRNAAVRNRKPQPFNTSAGYFTGTYNFSQIRLRRDITTQSPAVERGQVAALMYHLARESTARGGRKQDGLTVTYTSAMRNILVDFRIEHWVNGWFAATSVTGTNFSLTYRNSSKTRLRRALSNRWPVIMFGQGQGAKVGHFWVVDGYGTITQINRWFRNLVTGQ